MTDAGVRARRQLLIAPLVTMGFALPLAIFFSLETEAKPDMTEAFLPVAIGLIAAPGYLAGCLGSPSLLVGGVRRWAVMSAWLGVIASIGGVVVGAFTIFLAILSAGSGVSAFQLARTLRNMGSAKEVSSKGESGVTAAEKET